MRRTLSHLGYFAFLLLSLYLAFRGIEDFGLLFFGNIADASVTSVSHRRVRIGKRGHGVQFYAKYAFVAPDGETYRGSGEMGGGTPHEKGAQMPVRYLSFSPSVNAPKDDVVGSGAFLTIVGAFLTLIAIGAWRRKLDAERAAASKRMSPHR